MARFYRWFIGGTVLHLVDLETGQNRCSVQGWDESGWEEAVKSYFGAERPPICKRCVNKETSNEESK